MGGLRAQGEAVVGGALVEMAAMGGPEALAPKDAAAQSECGVAEVIGRQQQRRGAMAARGELPQAPEEQEADGQAADVA